jgi:hypothetical protein
MPTKIVEADRIGLRNNFFQLSYSRPMTIKVVKKAACDPENSSEKAGHEEGYYKKNFHN